MKRIFTYFCTIAISFLLSCPALYHTPAVVRAECAEESGYACVLGTAYFYASDDLKTELFLLPKTYFVKIISLGEPFSKIEYGGTNDLAPIVGYALTNALTAVSFTPKTPHPNLRFLVRYTVAGYENDPFFEPITLHCTYYGTYQVGTKSYAYALVDDSRRYVPLPDDFSYPLNDEYASFTAESNTPTQAEPTPTADFSVAIVVFFTLLIPVLSALLLRPSKKPAVEEYDD